MVQLGKEKVPTIPGVYFFRDAHGVVLYVGKSANLKQRVTSYFRASADLSPAKRRLLDEATNLTWEETGSEIEALLKEAHYIKKYQPRYNVLLRDDKTYLSIKITDEEFPRVLTTHKIEAGSTYYGPFTDARAVKETLRVLRKLFPYRTSCLPFVASRALRSNEAAKNGTKKGKPNSGRACLDSHLGLCPGICAGKVSAHEYRKTINRIKLFLAGHKGRVIATLRRELKALKHQRDEASRLRAERIAEQIRYLEKYLAMSHVLSFGEKAEGDVAELAQVLGLPTAPHRIEGYDISNIMGTLATASMIVFTDGRANKSEYRKFKIKTVRGANDVACLKETLRRRFHHSLLNHISGPMGPEMWHTQKNERRALWPMPDLVIIDGGRPQLGAALEVWRELHLSIPLISLAKRLEEIFIPGQVHPLVLSRTSPALHLAERVRDEAHRFAVSYHNRLRRKQLLRR